MRGTAAVDLDATRAYEAEISVAAELGPFARTARTFWSAHCRLEWT